MITTKTRADVLARDDYRCWYCPREAETVDHVIPRIRGGHDDPTNLAAACRDCNSGAGATPPSNTLVKQIEQKQHAWETARPQRVATAISALKEIWAPHQLPKERQAAAQINELLYWMPLAKLLKEIKDTPLNDASSPPWNHLQGRAKLIRYELLDRHDWSTNNAPVQRWNNLEEIVQREFQLLKQRIAQLEQKQFQMEKYLLAENE